MTAECGVVLKHWEETVERVACSPADPLGSKEWVVITFLHVSRVLMSLVQQDDKDEWRSVRGNR